MEPKFIKKKLILLLGFLIIFINILNTFVYFYKSDVVSICNEKSGVTVVVSTRGYYPIIATEASPKDAFSCMGKSIPHYSRVVGDLISTDTTIRQQIKKRYIYKPQKNRRDDIRLEQADKFYLIYFENEMLIIGSDEGISPFTVSKYLREDGPVVVYMPENSPKIDDMARKVIEGRGKKFHTLKSGQKTLIKLF